MVYLDRIYTRSGDAGETSLGDGTRVPKTVPRIAAYGTVDELNAVVGIARTTTLPAGVGDVLGAIQNDLFDLGADLCVPEADTPPETAPLRVRAGQVERLEKWIDGFNESLEPLDSFVLPAGTPAAAALHHARTVCRRAEIAVLELVASEPVNEQVTAYLNRLSDLLFVLARVANDNGRDDVTWIPGGEDEQANE